MPPSFDVSVCAASAQHRLRATACWWWPDCLLAASRTPLTCGAKRRSWRWTRSATASSCTTRSGAPAGTSGLTSTRHASRHTGVISV